jgi:hypothetical protein
MRGIRSISLIAPIAALVLAGLGCGLGGSPSKPTLPTVSISPITVGSDLSAVDLCAAIPTEDMEAVLGRPLVKQPEPFNLWDTVGVGGCSYDAGKDSEGTAYFAYVALTPVEVYDNQPLYLDTAVSGLGAEAYFNNGAAARELWVKVDDTIAFVIGIGDLENEAGARALAELLLAAIR